MRKIFNTVIFIIAILGSDFAFAATVPSRTARAQSAISNGTTVRAKVAPTALYSPECHAAYYGCMDQFCIPENASGGSCTCSDEHAALEIQMVDITNILKNANNIKTIEVEKIKAGANADIIFSGTRKYDANGNVITELAQSENDTRVQKKKDLMAIFETSNFDDSDIFESELDIISEKTGTALYGSADALCRAQMPANCIAEITILNQIYSTQIKSDCAGFKNDLMAKKSAANTELSNAQSDVRGALRDSFEAANKFDRGTCMVEFKKCMMTTDACGSDWSKCVSTIASENMQNKSAISTAGTKIKTTVKYDIADSTMEILNSKRNICEKVLNQCVAVRDNVWPDFLREAAPMIQVAELSAESKMRGSCLTDISKCIQTACRDDIAGRGVDTMDSCLSRPDMARSFCKVQIDSCERMEPLIWGYVKDKLAAMRVDACTAEVRECFTSDDRCGADFNKCAGMDYEYIHNICPLDKLVVCRANNPKFAMSDLDSMLMGLYLNIDNSALDNCQKLVDTKMAEICGSATDCNKFSSDDTIGTGSLRAQKDGTTYRVSGMISFGSIKMGDASGTMIDKGDAKKITLAPGQIGVADYLSEIRAKNSSVPNADAIISTIEEELNNIAGTINRTIDMIAGDPDIAFCVSGRDLSQITGKSESTTGRFPNLLNGVKMQIANSALRAANNNYNKKLNTEIAAATRDASADLAQYMCQKIAESGGVAALGDLNANTPLAPPYAISYDVGSGLTTDALMSGGAGVISTGGLKVSSGTSAGGASGSGMMKETTAIFSRDTRNCHVCTTVTTQSCSYKKKKGFLGIGASTSENCEAKTLDPECQDIVM